MLPILSSYQELPNVFHQKRAYNNYAQSKLLNHVNQVMQMNLQASLLNLINQGPTATTNRIHHHSNTLPLSSYINQIPQFPQVPTSELAGLLLRNKPCQQPETGLERVAYSKPDTYVKEEPETTYGSPDGGFKSNVATQDHSQSESSESGEEGLSCRSKKIKKTNECGHPERPHYAKNLCNQCYHKHGRTKKPWRCNHEKLYAHGLCQNCYINAYNKKRNQKSEEKEDVNVKVAFNDAENDVATSTQSRVEPVKIAERAIIGTFKTLNITWNTK